MSVTCFPWFGFAVEVSEGLGLRPCRDSYGVVSPRVKGVVKVCSVRGCSMSSIDRIIGEERLDCAVA